MRLTSLIRWCTGWVEFEAEGGLPARLLDEATAREVLLWGIQRKGIVLKARCAARTYTRLHRPARRAGMRIHVTKKRGLPFWLHRFRGRWGLAVGAALAILLLQLLSGRIWAVTVNGHVGVSEEALRQTAAGWGVYVGAPIDALNIELIRLHALTQMDGVAWLTVNLEGCVAHIELNESEPPVDILDTAPPSNLLAARDGWILKMEVFGGEAMVKPGDAVTEGTLLVSGATIADKSLLLRRSLGAVIAQTERELTVTVPYTVEQLEPSGTLYRLYFSFFGLDIPLSPGGELRQSYRLTQNERFLTADGVTLPIGLRHCHYTLLEPHDRVLSPTEAQAEAVRRLRALEQLELAEATVRESRYTGENTAYGYVLTGRYVCEENIAREQRIYVEE